MGVLRAVGPVVRGIRLHRRQGEGAGKTEARDNGHRAGGAAGGQAVVGNSTREREADLTARLGSARLGSARLGSARLGSARLGSARLGSARLGSARLGS